MDAPVLQHGPLRDFLASNYIASKRKKKPDCESKASSANLPILIGSLDAPILRHGLLRDIDNLLLWKQYRKGMTYLKD